MRKLMSEIVNVFRAIFVYSAY